MSSQSDYLRNKITDWLMRGQVFTPPATWYFGLVTSTKGLRANSTAYALNDTIFLTANDNKIHLYKCTTAGTTAAAQGTLYLGANNEVITDGTAVFTDQYAGLKSGTAIVEPAGGAYARVAVASSLGNFAGTQGAGTTTVSTGTSGTTSNNNAITFPAPTANWGMVGFVCTYDALTAGNLLLYMPLANTRTINSGDPVPSFAAGMFSNQVDN